MSRSPTTTPALVDHPKLGPIRALTSFAPHVRSFLESMIVEGDIRCVWHEGHQFVPLHDVEPYSVSELDGEEIAQILLSADHRSGGALTAAIKVQTSSDEIIRAKKVKLIDFVEANLNGGPAPHPFAQVRWMAFWGDVADVGANLAGDIEAQRVSEAMTILEESAANGTIDSVGVPHFHKVLLSLAAPELDERFDAIWSSGRGRLEIKDPEQHPMVVAILRRITTTFNGHRGDPEGSDTPRHLMYQYLNLMSLRAAT